MQAKEFLNNEKGMGLIEVLIAGIIFVFVLISFGYMFAVGQGLTGSGGDRRLALSYSQESMEELQALGFNWIEGDIGTLGVAPYNWSKTGDEWTGTDAGVPASHQRQITVAYVDDTDYDSIVSGPSNFLRLEVDTFPAGDPSVGFTNITLVTVVARP